ncbi:Odorant receptor 11 [Ephemera danica]|nr:Odorant receptor 11 [Ephemera danica]
MDLWPENIFPGFKRTLFDRCVWIFQKIMFVFSVTLLSFLCISNITHLLLVDRGKTFLNFTQTLMIICRQTFGLFKMYTYFKNKRELRHLLNDTFYDVPAPTCLRQQIKKYKQSCLKTPKVVSISSIIIIVALIPVLIGAPLQVTPVLKYQNSELVLLNLNVPKIIPQLIYIAQVLGIILVFNVAFGCIIIYIALLTIAHRMLDHLHEVLKTLHHGHKKIGKNKMLHDHQQRVADTLKYVVQHQFRINRFITRINDFYSNVMFLEVFSLHLVFSVATFQISQEGLTTMRYGMIPLLLIFLAIFTVCSWTANDVEVKSAAVEEISSHASWWTWNSSNRIVGQCVSEFANFKLHLNAGLFNSMSLDTFTDVLKISFSYFLFLHSLHVAQRKAD